MKKILLFPILFLRDLFMEDDQRSIHHFEKEQTDESLLFCNNNSTFTLFT